MSESNEKCYCSRRVNFFHRHFHVFETARAGRWVFAGFDMPEDVYRAGPDAGHQQQRPAMARGMVSCGKSFLFDCQLTTRYQKVVWMAFLRICSLALLAGDDSASKGTSTIGGAKAHREGKDSAGTEGTRPQRRG